ncbi:MAG: TetR/AcrR family transcriptional regulator [Mariprofundaceae bacterium]
MTLSEKQNIMEAARQRFSHYGYSKTTMSEIAEDCDMSVGNLYRFYKNKEAIAVEGANHCLLEKAEASEAAIKDEKDAVAALHTFLQVRLEYTHQLVEDTPHLYELVELISSRHAECLQAFEDRATRVIASILSTGIQSGQFQLGDCQRVAESIYHATIKFNMPLCMLQASLPQLKKELTQVIDLLIYGIIRSH